MPQQILGRFNRAIWIKIGKVRDDKCRYIALSRRNLASISMF
jgi:hypothetical protein